MIRILSFIFLDESVCACKKLICKSEIIKIPKENIFVPNGGLLQAKYWKLQSPGSNPYFFFGHRKGVLVAIPSAVIVGIMLSAGSFALPESYDLMFINDSGERLNVNEYNVKRLLKGNKTLLKKYKAEIYPTKGTMLDYILLYNESKLKN